MLLTPTMPEKHRLMKSPFNQLLLLFTLLLLANSQLSTQITTVNYGVSTEDFANPERGFYHYSETRSSSYNALDQTELESYRNLQTSDGANYSVRSTLVFRYFVLDNFKNSPISATILSQIGNDFSIARQAGVKLIPRFVYTVEVDNTTGCSDEICPPYGDAPKHIILNHINQLTPILQANADVIAAVQMGLIGIWGENYYTDFFGDASHPPNKLVDQNWQDRIDILSALLNAVPENRMIQVRYPQMKQRFVYGINAGTDAVSSPPLTAATAYQGNAISRIGFHNDCILASYTDYGTYSDYGNSSTSANDDTTNLKPYFAADSRYVVVGGETCNDDDYDPENNCSGTSPAAFGDAELRRMHYSYLNVDYNNEVNNDWQTGGCMDDIKRRLGYRLELVSGSYSSSGRPGGIVSFSLDIRNTGFAAPFNPRRVEIILRNATSGEKYYAYVNDDPRTWHTNITNSISYDFCLPVTLPVGTYDWLLNLPDPTATLEDDPNYSIRLASNLPGGMDVWESSTGYNDLGARLTVANNGAGSDCSNEITFTAVDSPLPVEWLNFTAAAAGEDINLHWETGWEIDNIGFEIERSEDGVSFTKIGEVAPQTDRNYQFTDTDVVAGQLYYYRIRQLDVDGTSSRSYVVTAKIDTLGTSAKAAFYPNPGNGLFTIDLSTINASDKFRVFNTQGRLLLEQQAATSLDLRTLPSGVYIVELKRNGKLETQRVVKF